MVLTRLPQGQTTSPLQVNATALIPEYYNPPGRGLVPYGRLTLDDHSYLSYLTILPCAQVTASPTVRRNKPLVAGRQTHLQPLHRSRLIRSGRSHEPALRCHASARSEVQPTRPRRWRRERGGGGRLDSSRAQDDSGLHSPFSPKVVA
jgi:hypothetical protein